MILDSWLSFLLSRARMGVLHQLLDTIQVEDVCYQVRVLLDRFATLICDYVVPSVRLEVLLSAPGHIQSDRMVPRI